MFYLPTKEQTFLINNFQALWKRKILLIFLFYDGTYCDKDRN